jgi:enoyl-CoA hydratase/carnithine racemase
MAYDEFETMHVTSMGGVVRAVIDHPPINLLDLPLMLELDRLGRAVEEDAAAKVLVLSSADEEFFIAHADVNLILGLPRESRSAPNDTLGFFHAMVDRFRTMPKATIAVIEGRVRGGGCELVSSLDMRFADVDRALLSQPEVALGIIPGGSGTQRLPALVGRARALEVILGCGDVDAATAEQWGWVNRRLPSPQLHAYVDELATRIASFPSGAIAAAKASANNALPDPVPGLCAEEWLFSRTLLEPETIVRMEQFLDIGGQTREVELDLTRLYNSFS